MPFKIIRQDLTKVAADAIVNTANPEPKVGAGTDTAVYMAAGAEKLMAAREKIGRIAPGEAAVTPAFALPAKYIIHTVGPVWMGGGRGEADLLRSCYRKSLLLAEQLGCESIAFPLISTGSYGFPKKTAIPIALAEIEKFLETSDMEVTLVVLGREALSLSEQWVGKVEQYLTDHMAEEIASAERPPRGELNESAIRWDRRERARRWFTAAYEDQEETDAGRPPVPGVGTPPMGANHAMPPEQAAKAALPPSGYAAETSSRPKPQKVEKIKFPAKRKLEDIMKHKAETFQEMLLRTIDQKGYTDAEVYKRANMDRRLFSKIRSNKDYQPSKKTALALAIALRLNLDETKDLIGRAGYAISDSSRSDLIVRYFIENGIYDIMEINICLFDFDEPQLA